MIEKEALASSWAREKFADYVTGMNFVLETDHKPLVPLLGSTDLAKMPPRILRFRLMLMSYSREQMHYLEHRLNVHLLVTLRSLKKLKRNLTGTKRRLGLFAGSTVLPGRVASVPAAYSADSAIF